MDIPPGLTARPVGSSGAAPLPQKFKQIQARLLMGFNAFPSNVSARSHDTFEPSKTTL
jgi:hypothetical protein